jgi:hypothetical protein
VKGGAGMAQVDTRHYEKEKLISLLIAELEPQTLPLQIAQTKAKMEPSDVDEVMKQFEEYKKTVSK